jgi:tRNA 2-thiouridine synthesizing protein A
MARVDVRGEICPRPALLVRQELVDLEAGDTLVVRGDYPPAERNLRRMCDRHGYEVGGAGAESDGAVPDDEFELRVRVTPEATLSEG